MTSQTILLWLHGAPGTVGDQEQDKPTITSYLPASHKADGAAVVICPGGGYGFLAVDHEGEQVARWLNERGIAAFVLRYRIAPRYGQPAPLQDAARALRTVRAGAASWNIDAQRIGIWGFSAGGHLAANLSTRFDNGDAASPDAIERVSSRPDFAILGYPVITFQGPHAHTGSRDNLLGPNAPQVLVNEYSNEAHVTPQTPPTFLFHTDADLAVPSENSVLFYLALRAAGVPAEMHIYAPGAHGLGLAQEDAALSTWPLLLENWMRGRDILRRKDLA
ncbi:MAG TPA: alpha/beta hydrolase [Abditibacteriaceae bacterium]|jgi:acetyl esterase/lipase